eukprot:UC4_evm4s543
MRASHFITFLGFCICLNSTTATEVNLALNRPVLATRGGYGGSTYRINDGDAGGDFQYHSTDNRNNFILIDLGSAADPENVKNHFVRILNRNNCCQWRVRNSKIWLLPDDVRKSQLGWLKDGQTQGGKDLSSSYNKYLCGTVGNRENSRQFDIKCRSSSNRWLYYYGKNDYINIREIEFWADMTADAAISELETQISHISAIIEKNSYAESCPAYGEDQTLALAIGPEENIYTNLAMGDLSIKRNSNGRAKLNTNEMYNYAFKIPNYMEFDDKADKAVVLGNAKTLGVASGSFTASAWVWHSGGTGDETIFGTWGTGTGKGLHLILRNKRVYIGFYGMDHGTAYVVPDQTWTYVTFQYNDDPEKTTGNQCGSINGMKFDCGGKRGAFSDTTDDVILGNWYAEKDNGRAFKGRIAYPEITKEILTEEQIEERMYLNTKCFDPNNFDLAWDHVGGQSGLSQKITPVSENMKTEAALTVIQQPQSRYHFFPMDGDFKDRAGGGWDARTDLGSAKTPTFQGAYINGKNRRVARFDGVDDYLWLPNAKHGGAAYSICGWVMYHEFNSWSRIVDFGNGAGMMSELRVFDGKEVELQDVVAYFTGQLTQVQDQASIVGAMLQNTRAQISSQLSSVLQTIQNQELYVHHWPLSGSLRDIAGGGWDGKGANNFREASINGQQKVVLDFDGVNDYVQLPTITHGINGAYSVCGWVKYRSFNSWSRIIDFGNGAWKDNIIVANEGSTPTFVWELHGTASKVPGCKVANFWEANKWIHFCAVMDMDSSKRVYKNGKLAEECTHNSDIVANMPQKTRSMNFIGKSNWPDGYLNAQVSDLRVFDGSSLDAATIGLIASGEVINSQQIGRSLAKNINEQNSKLTKLAQSLEEVGTSAKFLTEEFKQNKNAIEKINSAVNTNTILSEENNENIAKAKAERQNMKADVDKVFGIVNVNTVSINITEKTTRELSKKLNENARMLAEIKNKALDNEKTSKDNGNSILNVQEKLITTTILSEQNKKTISETSSNVEQMRARVAKYEDNVRNTFDLIQGLENSAKSNEKQGVANSISIINLTALVDKETDILTGLINKLDETTSQEQDEILEEIKNSLGKSKRHTLDQIGEKGQPGQPNTVYGYIGAPDSTDDNSVFAYINNAINISTIAIATTKNEMDLFRTSVNQDINSFKETVPKLESDTNKAIIKAEMDLYSASKNLTISMTKLGNQLKNTIFKDKQENEQVTEDLENKVNKNTMLLQKRDDDLEKSITMVREDADSALERQKNKTMLQISNLRADSDMKAKNLRKEINTAFSNFTYKDNLLADKDKTLENEDILLNEKIIKLEKKINTDVQNAKEDVKSEISALENKVDNNGKIYDTRHDTMSVRVKELEDKVSILIEESKLQYGIIANLTYALQNIEPACYLGQGDESVAGFTIKKGSLKQSADVPFDYFQNPSGSKQLDREANCNEVKSFIKLYYPCVSDVTSCCAFKTPVTPAAMDFLEFTAKSAVIKNCKETTDSNVGSVEMDFYSSDDCVVHKPHDFVDSHTFEQRARRGQGCPIYSTSGARSASSSASSEGVAVVVAAVVVVLIVVAAAAFVMVRNKSSTKKAKSTRQKDASSESLSFENPLYDEKERSGVVNPIYNGSGSGNQFEDDDNMYDDLDLEDPSIDGVYDDVNSGDFTGTDDGCKCFDIDVGEDVGDDLYDYDDEAYENESQKTYSEPNVDNDLDSLYDDM